MIENHSPQINILTGHRLKESRSKKIQKVPKRNLNPTFTIVTEKISSETGKELIGLSPASEASESSVLTSISSEAFSDPNISINFEDPVNMSMNRCVFHELDSSVEAGLVSSYLQKARNEVVNSSNVDEQSKKLLDAVLKVILDECSALHEERDLHDELVSAQGRILFLCIVLWSFILSAIFFFRLLWDSSYNGPLAT
ncbi:hypothetical protein M5689_005325 [Euphorbia peplus]|nr:hypothetical protein M5689_005325 [Euphorbia peplus]